MAFELGARSAWISDLHLGTRGCQAEFLLDFLRSLDCDNLFLVGDIVDLWALKRSRYWPAAHNAVVHELMRKARAGVRVTYIPGNHDEWFRDYPDLRLAGVEIHPNYIHTTANGLRLLVMHGDEFDGFIRYNRLLAWLGDYGYDRLLELNQLLNFVRRRIGLPYWSLAGHIKTRLSNVSRIIKVFETAAIHAAEHHGVDGVVCGHIHRPELTHIDERLYCNCGDWVESCTALVESQHGQLDIVHWADHKHSIKQAPVELLVSRKVA